MKLTDQEKENYQALLGEPGTPKYAESIQSEIARTRYYVGHIPAAARKMEILQYLASQTTVMS